MAEEFGADLAVAEKLALDLREIRVSMNGLGAMFGRYSEATGSARLDQELRRFIDESSDSREAMDGLLKRATGMLQGLVHGSRAVDRSLSDALTTDGTAK